MRQVTVQRFARIQNLRVVSDKKKSWNISITETQTQYLVPHGCHVHGNMDVKPLIIVIGEECLGRPTNLLNMRSTLWPPDIVLFSNKVYFFSLQHMVLIFKYRIVLTFQFPPSYQEI